MNTKQILAAGAAVVAGAALAVPEVSNVTMSQASDSRLVTIGYDLDEDAVVTLDVQTNATVNGETVWYSIGGAAISGTATGKTAGGAKGDVWKKVAAGSGKSITWRPDLTWPDHKIADGGARAVVTAWALDNTPDYMAVDITATGGADTQTYYPAADFVPGGVTNSLYKTTMLLMRKIMAKDVKWTMGSTPLETRRTANREDTHQVTLTNNYYIGVYEVTQSQWDLVQPSRSLPSAYNNVVDRAMRPVEQVSYNEIRNSNNSTTADATYNWPAAPNPNSFLGKLRTKSGLDFDLPSEAQWEFAARAGNGDTKWGDGSGILNTDTDANLTLLGRYQRNGGQVHGTSYTNPAQSCGATNGTAIVGSYLPNAWGLYDMHGNVWEWCLDWYQEDIATAKDVSDELYGGRVNIDPSNSASYLSGVSVPNDAVRMMRGGAWNAIAGSCRPAFRGTGTPTARVAYIGFRVLCSAGLR